jgi:hypothetical protein
MTDPRPAVHRLRPALVLAAAIGVVLLIVWSAQAEIVFVTEEQNGELPSASYTLLEDDLHHPRLELLRTREKLDEITSGALTQFQTALRLRAWTHRQWQPGASFYYPPWDAAEILDLVRQHGNRGFCAQYAVVFLQACQAMGIHARYIDLMGHFVVAIWSDDFDRWVLMDPMNDLHYERYGIPMRGGQLHQAFLKNDVEGIEQVDSSGNRKQVARGDLEHYRLYAIDTVANQLTAPVEVRINGAWTTLRHADDYQTYPRVGRDQLVVDSDFLAWRPAGGTGEMESYPQRPQTQNPDDFRYAFNQTILLLANERLSNRILKVALLNPNSPTFERFEVRSDESKVWTPAPSPTIRWLLHPGTNELRARIAMREGWKGPVSSLRLYYKAPLFASLPAFRGYVFRMFWHRTAEGG